MHLVQVDVIGSQAAQAVLAGFDDVVAVTAPRVGVGVVHFVVDFGGEKHAVAPSVLRQCFARDGLAYAPAVHIGGVEEINALVHGPVHDANRVRFGRAAFRVAPVHAAQTQGADLYPGAPQRSVFHNRYISLSASLWLSSHFG